MEVRIRTINPTPCPTRWQCPSRDVRLAQEAQVDQAVAELLQAGGLHLRRVVRDGRRLSRPQGTVGGSGAPPHHPWPKRSPCSAEAKPSQPQPTGCATQKRNGIFNRPCGILSTTFWAKENTIYDNSTKKSRNSQEKVHESAPCSFLWRCPAREVENSIPLDCIPFIRIIDVASNDTWGDQGGGAIDILVHCLCWRESLRGSGKFEHCKRKYYNGTGDDSA